MIMDRRATFSEKPDGEFGATSLKEELVERFPVLSDAASFRYARHVLQTSLGGAVAIGDELQVAGSLNGNTGLLSIDKPSQIFARIADGQIVQPNMEDENEALGAYKNRFKICKNRIENDLHWDSTDPKWVDKSSMARRHRFLTTKNLHWQWFNALVFGLVPAEAGGVSLKETFEEVEAMKAAALHYTRNLEGWSDRIGLYVNVFGHNSVNCLFIHILDMAALGPSFEHLSYKNLSLDLVLQVLGEELCQSVTIQKPISSRNLSGVEALKISQIGGTGGATSLKAEITAKVSELKTVSQFRLVRKMLHENLGGPQALFNELQRAGLVSDDGQLTTGTKPFNLFARIAAGEMSQPGMDEEQEALQDYRDRWVVCKNRPENDDNWDSKDAEWVGKASMARRHRFLTTKDLHWQWFNALTFGLVPEEMGGVDIKAAIDKVEEMKAAALTYCHNMDAWSEEVGLYFHVFGHNSVNSLHLHMLDLKETGPTYDKYVYKNMPLDRVLKVLKEELLALSGETMLKTPSRRRSVFYSSTDDKEEEEKSKKLEERQKWEAEILELNIGGTHMTTRRSTLLVAPEGSLLRSMFDGSEEGTDEKKRHFVDLPPESFQVILNRLRMRRLDADATLLPRDMHAELRETIKILGVESLFPELGNAASSALLSCFSWCR